MNKSTIKSNKKLKKEFRIPTPRNTEKRINFYVVETASKIFFLGKNDIVPKTIGREKDYNIKVVEYIGTFAGKEDVICITSGKRKTYQTYIDVDTIAIYYEYKINGITKYSWKSKQNISLSIYYDEFKKMGIQLRYDVYYYEKLFRKAIYQQLS